MPCAGQIAIFTRYPGGCSFDRSHGGLVQIRTLLGQKDTMALPESVPLSALDKDNQLTILARVFPLQEGEPDHHARLLRPPTPKSATDERKAQPGGSSVLAPIGKALIETREQSCMAIDTMVLLANGTFGELNSCELGVFRF